MTYADNDTGALRFKSEIANKSEGQTRAGREKERVQQQRMDPGAT